jgi:Tol biopolymer transport system component
MKKFALLLALFTLIVLVGCSKETSTSLSVPHQEAWGIYKLDLTTDETSLIWSSGEAISFLALNHAGDKFAFNQKVGGSLDTNEEIFLINTDGTGLTRLTSNNYRDIYPSFSPDDSKIVFLSWRNLTFDLYTMNSDGSGQARLYDSGGQDADVSWGPSRIAFTRDSQIWTLNPDGSDARQLTDPPNAGEWGIANLPLGDYDPRFSPDGSKVVFERMVDVNASVFGSYDIFAINSSGAAETRLTATGYSQGMPEWSHAGDKIVFLVSAINDAGKYRIYMMNADGSDNRDITPSYFPDGFLCRAAVFSKNDSSIYFLGQWY